MDANTLLSELKKSIDDLWMRYGNVTTLNTLVYAKQEYGIMQYSELSEIMDTLSELKNRIDELSEDCQSIPRDMQNTA